MSEKLDKEWVASLIADDRASQTVRLAAVQFQFASELAKRLNNRWFENTTTSELADRETGYLFALVMAGGTELDIEFLIQESYLPADSTATFKELLRVMGESND
jgi:hypothetical protein